MWITPTILGEGGTLCQTASRGTLAALAKLGWEITVVSPSSQGTRMKDEIDGHIWHKLSLSKIKGFQSLLLERNAKKVVSNILKNNIFDLVIVNWSLCRYIIPLMRKQKIPIIVDDRSPPVHEDIIGKLQWLHYNICWKYAALTSDGFSFNTPALLEMVTKKYNLNGPSCFYPSAAEPEKYTKSELLEGQMPTLVYHGLIDKERGIYEILNASEIIKSRGFNIKLVIFGKGNDLSRLKKMEEKLEWFELLDSCPPNQVPSRLSNMHIGIIPLPDKYQWKFSSPLKLFEYASSGLNVIATDIQCHRLIGERPWLKLVNVEDTANSIADSVIEIINNDEWGRNSAIAFKDASKEFGWDNSVVELNRMMMSLINKRR